MIDTVRRLRRLTPRADEGCHPRRRKRRSRRAALLRPTVLIAIGLALGGVSAGSAAAAGPDAVRVLAGCQEHTLPRNDDSSTGRITLPFELGFFGETYTSLFVNNNGNVTFDAPLFDYTPYPLSDGRPGDDRAVLRRRRHAPCSV